MNLPCSIVQDLLPLYASGLASQESTDMVKAHLATCPACSRQFQQMQTEAVPAPPELPLRKVRREIRQRKWNAVCLTACVVLLVLFTLFSHLTAPAYPAYSESLVTISQSETGDVYATFSAPVTQYRAQLLPAGDGAQDLALEAWTTPLDSAWNRDGFTVLLLHAGQTVRTVFYCDNANGGELIPLWGTQPSGGGASLPQLVLSYYLLLALGVTCVTGVAWLLLRKTKFQTWCSYLFPCPLAYLVGQLLTKGLDTVTFHAPRDIVYNLLVALSFYGAWISLFRLVQQVRRDRL